MTIFIPFVAQSVMVPSSSTWVSHELPIQPVLHWQCPSTVQSPFPPQ